MAKNLSFSKTWMFPCRQIVLFVAVCSLFAAAAFAPAAAANELQPASVLSLAAGGTPNAGEKAAMALNWTCPAASGKSRLWFRAAGDTAWHEVTPKNKIVKAKKKEIASFSASMKRLEPGKVYEYRIVPRKGPAGPLHRFTAPAVNPEKFTFVAWGDSRVNLDVARLLAQEIALEDPAFVVHTGDMVSRNSAKQWRKFSRAMGNLASDVPFMAIAGNHEGLSKMFQAYFNMPANGSAEFRDFWYSFDYGSLHAVCLYTGHENRTRLEQTEWLIRDLERARKRPGTKWILVFTHAPPFSSGRHGPHLAMFDPVPPSGQSWLDIFEAAGVDAVISGHDHNYERSHRILNFRPGPNGDMKAGEINNFKGIYYIVSGGGGAPQRDMKPRETIPANSWMATRKPDPDQGQTAAAQPCFHYLLIKVNPDKLRIFAKETDASILPGVTDDDAEGVFDMVEIKK